MQIRYQLFMPKPDEHGRTMFDYFSGKTPAQHEYECVFDDTIEFTGHDVIGWCEHVWRRHNLGIPELDGNNRPRGREIRSMCTGDIVRLHDVDAGVFIADSVGFYELHGDEIPVLDDSRPWAEVSHA